jgi:lipid II:glycine glycyltransferase (peptidoglycan interpeptide bridge formation enzyme)
MLEIKIELPLLNYTINYYSEHPALTDRLKFVQYSQCKSTADYYGFIKQKCFTKIIDLSRKQEDIFSNYKKNTKYEINRAKKHGIVFDIETNLEQFANFYNLFAKSTERPSISVKYLNCFGNNLVITKATHDDCNLVMHAYVTDHEIKRVRLLHSGSLFRYEADTEKIQLIGMANRFLHFADMLFFKRNSYLIYDLGGYDVELKDGKLIALNRFKDSFGGDLLEESLYISYPLYIYRYLRIIVKTLVTRIRKKLSS